MEDNRWPRDGGGKIVATKVDLDQGSAKVYRSMRSYQAGLIVAPMHRPLALGSASTNSNGGSVFEKTTQTSHLAPVAEHEGMRPRRFEEYSSMSERTFWDDSCL